MRRWYRILNQLGGIRVAARCVRNAALVGSVGVALKSHSSPPSSSSSHRIIPVHYETNEELQVQTDHKLSKRELRFLTFASVEYDDVIYMTPMDFLDSLTLDEPRERIYRRILKKEDVDAMLAKTPLLCEGNKNFLRKLDQNGVISFAEYIFLLTLLTKSQQSFRIAFTMFDKDGNGRIEKDEFLLVKLF